MIDNLPAQQFDTLQEIEAKDPMLSDEEVEVKDYTAPSLIKNTEQTAPPPPPVFKIPKATLPKEEESSSSKIEEDASTDYSDTDVEPQFSDLLSGEKLGALLGGQSLSVIVISVFNQFLSPMVANMAVPIKPEVEELKSALPEIYRFFREKNHAAREAVCFSESESKALSEVWEPILAEVGVGEITPMQRAIMTTGAIALSKGVAVYGLRKQSDEQFSHLMDLLRPKQIDVTE